LPIDVTNLGIVIDVKLVQDWNVLSLIYVSVSGIVIDEKLEQRVNACVPRDVRFEVGVNIIVVKLIHFWKAAVPINVTVSGINIDVNPVLANAPEPRDVTNCPTVTSISVSPTGTV